MFSACHWSHRWYKKVSIRNINWEREPRYRDLKVQKLGGLEYVVPSGPFFFLICSCIFLRFLWVWYDWSSFGLSTSWFHSVSALTFLSLRPFAHYGAVHFLACPWHYRLTTSCTVVAKILEIYNQSFFFSCIRMQKLHNSTTNIRTCHRQQRCWRSFKDCAYLSVCTFTALH